MSISLPDRTSMWDFTSPLVRVKLPLGLLTRAALTRVRSSFARAAGLMTLLLVQAGSPLAAQTPTTYEKSTPGTRWLESASGVAIKVLVEASNLGSADVDVAEITFPPGTGATGGGHRHGAIEIFYVLSGRLDHVVNGVSHVIDPGGVGMVRPGDDVIHRVLGDEPVRALVIWAPGGEAERISRSFTQRPIRADRSNDGT